MTRVPAARRAAQAADQRAEMIAKLIESAPPLTDEQRERLRTLISDNGHGRPKA